LARLTISKPLFHWHASGQSSGFLNLGSRLGKGFAFNNPPQRIAIGVKAGTAFWQVHLTNSVRLAAVCGFDKLGKKRKSSELAFAAL